MEGDFTSYGHSFHFTTENGLREHINSFIRQSFSEIYSSPYLYKKEKIFEFYIDEDTYYFNLPPIILKPKEHIKKHHTKKKQLIEIPRYYFERNSDYITKQINTIVELFKNGDTKINKVLFSNNIFENRKQRFLTESFGSLFDDASALELCNKLSSPFIRTLLKNPISNKIEIHKIAMKCYEKYGGHVVSFILSLPKLQFGNYNSKTIVAKTSYQGEIPSLKIKFLKQNLEYFLCFYEPKKRVGRETTVASIFNNTQKKVEGFLTYTGYIEYRINKENISLKLFLENINNHKIISCSIESGRCINCKRDLTDTNSLRVGYGKDCANDLGIPYY
jgi:hypothetical protein